MSIERACAALGDPTRLAMVERLARGPASLSELAAPLPMSLTAVSKHLAVLVEAGWVQRHKAGRVVTCRLLPGPLDEISRWSDDVRGWWDGALDRLGAAIEPAARTIDHPNPL